MNSKPDLVLFFIVNSFSGNRHLDYTQIIQNYFKATSHITHFYPLPKNCSIQAIKGAIARYNPDRVIAVGGDGTVKLAAECLMGTSIPLAIIPAGSANGMAKEMNIKSNPKSALDTVIHGIPRRVHALLINKQLSIHLADIGINARIIKKFQSSKERGMTGYAKAAWQTFKRHKKMHVTITTGQKMWARKAEMVVIANGTTYGTGVKINKTGSLYDDHFEVIIVKWFSLLELLKMCFSFKTPFNPFKTEIIQTDKVTLKIKENTFFQIDGEYIGKVNLIEAEIIKEALYIISP
ncbi:NAD(+)/NADH kinase [Olivibacter sp. SDN3]|uniref:diacylglycerol/lipid kinase family protein n=1 Tax=Olivibacter sp. SDN3 TaxID=2764720 RepID=UPI00165109E1|nr:diacylglycerol kinase family protein [Olivibacter sp. SDN3]QNL50526.1 NAD(+)/NADH kinase [Olivibacter sp. SDN3]